MKKKTIMLDLDGVLNTYNGFYDPVTIPPMRDGAREFLDELSKKYKLVLFSSRDLDYVRRWAEMYDIANYFEDITNVKQAAYLIIDDRCIRFDGSFPETLKAIDKFGVWWRQVGNS